MYNGNCIFHVCLIKSVEIYHSAIQFPFSHQLLGLAVDWKSFKCVNIEINDFCHKCNILGHVPDFDKNCKFYLDICCVVFIFKYLYDQTLYLTVKTEPNL